MKYISKYHQNAQPDEMSPEDLYNEDSKLREFQQFENGMDEESYESQGPASKKVLTIK